MKKILFILKRREDYSVALHSSSNGLSTGLFNSASFVKDMMLESGFSAHLEIAIDNNCIDRLVTKHKPTDVIIEALWVVPSKFAVLEKLHPNVNWIVRLHSEMPFIACEGISMDWVMEYLKYERVSIAINAPRFLDEIRNYASNIFDKATVNQKIVYLPNYYPLEYKQKELNKEKDVIDISCFGAVRPLKNHLLQAHAAVKFANFLGKKLRFHINVGRTEMKGEPVLHNLIAMFKHLENSGHQLVMHQWTPREQFLEICGSMDIGMQVSFTETFNIVGADLISQGVPLVSSKEVPWAASLFNSDPTSFREIYFKLILTYYFNKLNVFWNQKNLSKYCSDVRKQWERVFSKA